MSDATQPGRNRRQNGIPSPAWLKAGVALANVALVLLALSPAAAQAPDRPTLTLAATIAAEPATQIPFAIRVGPPSSVPRNSFVRVRGLPRLASLSDGHAIAPGAWAIPLAALPDLKVTIPSDAVGRSEVDVTLVTATGVVLAKVTTTLIVSPRLTASPAAKAVAGEETPLPPPSKPAVPAEDRRRAIEIMKKGDSQLANGRAGPARLLYERAAGMGLAEAAMALAATYDAAELERPNLRGVMPDAKLAKHWYESARALGAREAEQRLLRLGAN